VGEGGIMDEDQGAKEDDPKVRQGLITRNYYGPNYLKEAYRIRGENYKKETGRKFVLYKLKGRKR
jgi:hypothetical protein